MSQPDADGDAGPAADRVVVSYPADLSRWGRDILEDYPFRTYLSRTLGAVEPGHAFEEFLDVGCCGDTMDVPLRVEAVEGGTRVTRETEVAYEVREACGMAGGWAVQSAGTPTSEPSTDAGQGR